MPTGIVKWFNPTKGYGFVTPDGTARDAFIHITEVQRSGLTTLVQGQRVAFELREETTGLKAFGISAAE